MVCFQQRPLGAVQLAVCARACLDSGGLRASSFSAARDRRRGLSRALTEGKEVETEGKEDS